MSRRINTEVLVVGGGPVGLSLAMDLARRGVGVTLAETRAAAEPSSVRCNHVSARTMEIFRRLGVAGAVRDAGLPADYPNDVAFRTTATGIEMARIPIPCRAQRYTTTDGPDTWWPTPEPPHRINQIYLEPVPSLNRADLEAWHGGRHDPQLETARLPRRLRGLRGRGSSRRIWLHRFGCGRGD